MELESVYIDSESSAEIQHCMTLGLIGIKETIFTIALRCGWTHFTVSESWATPETYLTRLKIKFLEHL